MGGHKILKYHIMTALGRCAWDYSSAYSSRLSKYDYI